MRNMDEMELHIHLRAIPLACLLNTPAEVMVSLPEP